MCKKAPLFLSTSSRTIWSNTDQGPLTSKDYLDAVMLGYNDALYRKDYLF